MLGKQSLGELSKALSKSTRTLQRHFDQLTIHPTTKRLFDMPINLIVDATFFSRSDGV